MGGSSSKPIHYLPEFEANLPLLTDKVVAITGCTSGTGLVAAKVMVRKGAAVVLLLNRPSERATEAEQTIRAELPTTSSSSSSSPTTIIETIPCDLLDFESVRAAAATIRSKGYDALDVLCNNAGIMAMDDKATKDGYDVQMQTNHLSHFLLTKELFPLLQKAAEIRGEARIVNHSSLARIGKLVDRKYLGKNGGNLGGNSGSMFTAGAKWQRYQQSKLANVVFTMALKDKLAAAAAAASSTTDTSYSKIKAVGAAPGYSLTNLQTTSEGMDGALWTRVMAQSAEDGTMPLLEACFGPTTESGDFWEPSKYGGTNGPAVKVQLTSECLDEASRKVLWNASEAAVGSFTIE